MGLDDHGKLAAATIVFYIPYFAIAFFLTLRHGFRRDAGWIFLLIFSFIRILGGAMLIAAELVTPFNQSLWIAAIVLESVGLSPLLLATLGFLRTVGRGSFGETVLGSRAYKILGTLAIVGVILSVVGGTEMSSPNDASNAQTFRRVGSLLLAGMFVGLAFLHLWAWSFTRSLAPHYRTMLAGISCAIPFLAVRLIFGVLSSFSTLSLTPSATPASSSALEKFNIVTGTWWIFLLMALVMEYTVVGIYMLVGTLIPISKEEPVEYDMESQGGGYAQPRYPQPQYAPLPVGGSFSGYRR